MADLVDAVKILKPNEPGELIYGYFPKTQAVTQDIALGSGVVTANTQRVTLATDGPTVTAIGAPADSAATTDTGTFSLIALAKRALQNWTTLLSRIPTLTVTSARLLVDGSGVTQPTAPNITRGSGVVDANTQRVTLATDGPTVTAIGAIADNAATTDTGSFSILAFLKRGLQNWTTLLARVPALQSGAVPVGDNSGSLTVDGRSYRSTVSFTRPSNTTQYTANDVLGIADAGTPANAGSAIHTLTSVGPSNGFILIQSISLVFSDAAVISGMAGFRIHLYSSSPTAILDNAPHDLVSGDRSSYMGYVDLPAPQDLGSTLYTQADYPGRMVRLGSASTSMFVQIQTLGTYTPASGSTIDLRVNTIEMGL